MLSPATLEKVKNLFYNRSKIDEIIQDGNTLYSLRFVKGDKGKIVAELTNIDNDQSFRLHKKYAKPATLVDFRM